MPLAIPAIGAVMLGLLALLLLLGAKAFFQALASIFPKSTPIIGGVVNTAIVVAEGVAEAALSWVMAALIRPVINFILAPVFAFLNWIAALETWIDTTVVQVNWITDAAIPQVIGKLEGYARDWVHAGERYAAAILAVAESHLKTLISAARHYAGVIVGELRTEVLGWVHHANLYAASLVTAATVTLEHDVNLARDYAHTLVLDATATIGKQLSVIDAELAGLAGLSLSAVQQLVGAGVTEAETVAITAAGALVTDLDHAAAAAAATIWTGVIDDVISLEGVLGADLPDIGAAIRAIPRVVPFDLAGTAVMTGALTDVMVRYLEQCGIPNCRNLSGIGRALQELFALVEGGLFLGLLAEMVSDPAGTAHAVSSELGGVAQDAIDGAKSLLGVA